MIADLDLNPLAQIELLLVAAEIKPAATITLRKPLNLNRPLHDFLADQAISFQPAPQDAHVLHLSLKPEYVDTLADISLDSTAATDIRNRGLLYGYPEAAVELYAQVIADNQSPANDPRLNLNPTQLKTYFWYTYIRYATRTGHEYDDSLVAKTWAEYIRDKYTALHHTFDTTIRSIV